MKRIIAISALTAVACVGFGSVAHGQAVTATSTQTGTVVTTCSVTGTGATFTPTTSNINGVDFPVGLTGTGSKFTTLCNTATSAITVEKNAAPAMPGNQTTPSVTYDLAGSAAVYPAAGFLTNGVDIDTAKTGTAVHSYSSTPSDLTVPVKITAQSGKILENGLYTVVLKATLTP